MCVFAICVFFGRWLKSAAHHTNARCLGLAHCNFGPLANTAQRNAMQCNASAKSPAGRLAHRFKQHAAKAMDLPMALQSPSRQASFVRSRQCQVAHSHSAWGNWTRTNTLATLIEPNGHHCSCSCSCIASCRWSWWTSLLRSCSWLAKLLALLVSRANCVSVSVSS